MEQWTSAAEEIAALRRAAARARCVVQHASERETAHGRRAIAGVSCSDGWGAARFLLALSIEDSRTAAARSIALELWSSVRSDAEYVAAVFDYARERLQFVREEGEVFARSDYTIATGAGDCDDHARVVYALLRAGGVPARLAFLYRKTGDGNPLHVVAQAAIKGRGWVWLETTVAAELGEHPYAAAQRLGVVNSRSDIATEVRTMSESDLRPVPEGFASRTSPAQLARDVAELQRLGYLCDGAQVASVVDPDFRRAVADYQRAQGRITIDGLIGTETRGTLGSLIGGQQLTHADARDILRRAYVAQFGREPSGGELDFGLATAFFETFYGRGTAAAWGDGGQFGRWASEGKLNWGALQSGTEGDERTMQAFRAAGLHPTKERGRDAGRPVFFYLFPSDLEAARAFLMSWGKPDTLQAASTGSAVAVSTAMRRHGYYEGFHVPPGGITGGKKSPPFVEESSAAVALEKNIADYAAALSRNVAVVRGPGGVPDPFPTGGGSGGASALVAVLLVTAAAATAAGAWWLGGRA